MGHQRHSPRQTLKRNPNDKHIQISIAKYASSTYTALPAGRGVHRQREQQRVQQLSTKLKLFSMNFAPGQKNERIMTASHVCVI
jgi:hypothetical protein